MDRLMIDRKVTDIDRQTDVKFQMESMLLCNLMLDLLAVLTSGRACILSSGRIRDHDRGCLPQVVFCWKCLHYYGYESTTHSVAVYCD